MTIYINNRADLHSHVARITFILHEQAAMLSYLVKDLENTADSVIPNCKYFKDILDVAHSCISARLSSLNQMVRDTRDFETLEEEREEDNMRRRDLHLPPLHKDVGHLARQEEEKRLISAEADDIKNRSNKITN